MEFSIHKIQMTGNAVSNVLKITYPPLAGAAAGAAGVETAEGAGAGAGGAAR